LKRTMAIAAALTIAASLAAADLAQASGTATLSAHRTSVGTILVDSHGFTVYAFTRDSRNHDSCVKVAGCISVWPPLTTSGKLVAGGGVKPSLLGVIAYKGSLKQVTYAGHPLYTYVGDSGPAQTSYIGVSQSGGSWPALSPSGAELK
jgi:predicted lipoprotein with Yx(FWY)xxD motif